MRITTIFFLLGYIRLEGRTFLWAERFHLNGLREPLFHRNFRLQLA